MSGREMWDVASLLELTIGKSVKKEAFWGAAPPVGSLAPKRVPGVAVKNAHGLGSTC